MNSKWLYMIVVVFASLGAQKSYASECGHVAGYDELLEHRLVMIGEMHGTREVPAYFSELVCAVLESESSVAVGLELPVTMASSLDQYLNSSEKNAQALLLDDPTWSPAVQDGRTSAAMLALIQDLAELKHQHDKRISVHLIDNPSDYLDGGMSKGQSLADNIQQMEDQTDADYLLTLTGNYHNRIGVPAEQSAAMNLPDLNPYTVSVNWKSGEMWACTDQTPDGCGETKLPERDVTITTTEIVPVDNKKTYWHARLDIPELSSSPPATELAID